MEDLIVLVADNDMANTMEGLLTRHHSLAIRSITTRVMRHPERDPGCAIRGVDFLSRYSDQYHHGLLVFDHEGSGKEKIDRMDLQETLNAELAQSSWGTRARTIVISPELESWIWSDSPEVDAVLRWNSQAVSLRHWLINEDWVQENCPKPKRPKEAFLAALRETRTPRSAALYSQLAKRVSLRRCQDPAFMELRALLQAWFSSGGVP